MEEKKLKGTMRKFFAMVFRAKLPWRWILAEIVVSFAITEVGISVTEYTSEMFAGNLSFTGVILPFIIYSVMIILVAAVSKIVGGICTAKMDRNLRRMLWRKIVHLPYRFYEKNEPGELISRLTTDITAISGLVTQLFVGLITTAYATIAVFKKIESYDTKLMLTMLVLLPVQVVLGVIVGRLQFNLNDKVNQKQANLTQAISERTDQTMLIKSFGTEEKEIASVGSRMKEYYKAYIQNSWVSRFLSPVYAIVTALQFIVLVLVGRSFYSSGAISLAQWVAFFAFSNQIVTNLSSYVDYWTNFRSTQGATWRVSKVMDEPEENRKAGETVQKLSGDIHLENMSFGYGQELLFENCNLTIPQGKITAIVGPSGSGKTTLLNLIDRLYEPSSGCIRIGDTAINNYSLESYRKAVTYITQEALLFSGSVKENLVYGLNAEISLADLQEACAKADILEDILAMPHQFDTSVGENGSKLSGGQRQKLSMARAFLHTGDYLFMDEGTAAMDAQAKDAAWASLRQLMQGKTTVFVAHDRQTIYQAYYIVVLEAGMVLSHGKAEEMLKQDPYLQKMLEVTEDEEA